MPTSPEDDLDQLSHAAQSGLEQSREKMERVRSRQNRASPWRKVLSFAAILCATVFLLSNVSAIRAVFFGLPKATKIADAEVVLEAARAAVEQNRTLNRALPDRVPLAALDALVRMERTPEGSYVLYLDANGVRARMDAAGVMTLESE